MGTPVVVAAAIGVPSQARTGHTKEPTWETGRRWADLLACEFHAHEVLAEAGLALAGTRLMDAGGRRFLEIPRFDRSGAAGRMGLVSLDALSAASAGLARDWSAAGGELLRRGLINAGSLATVQRIQTFGELIGNSDMHAGNLAFSSVTRCHCRSRRATTCCRCCGRRARRARSPTGASLPLRPCHNC